MWYRYGPLMKDVKKFEKFMTERHVPGDIFEDYEYSDFGVASTIVDGKLVERSDL